MNIDYQFHSNFDIVFRFQYPEIFILFMYVSLFLDTRDIRLVEFSINQFQLYFKD